MVVVSLPVLAAMVRGSTVLGVLVAGAALWLIGFVFESGGDAQLAAFKVERLRRVQPAHGGRPASSRTHVARAGRVPAGRAGSPRCGGRRRRRGRAPTPTGVWVS